MLNEKRPAYGSETVNKWPFDLGETVRLTWNNHTGLVVGSGQYIHKDCEFLVEYVNDAGELVCAWLHEEMLDHDTVVQ